MSDLHNKSKVYNKDASEAQDTFQVGFHGHNIIHTFQFLTKDTTFSHYLLIVYTYSKIPKLYGMENITT